MVCGGSHDVECHQEGWPAPVEREPSHEDLKHHLRDRSQEMKALLKTPRRLENWKMMQDFVQNAGAECTLFDFGTSYRKQWDWSQSLARRFQRNDASKEDTGSCCGNAPAAFSFASSSPLSYSLRS